MPECEDRLRPMKFLERIRKHATISEVRYVGVAQLLKHVPSHYLCVC